MILNGSPNEFDDVLVGKHIENAIRAHEYKVHLVLEFLFHDVGLTAHHLVDIPLFKRVLLDFVVPNL